jgi:photosystem II stability/assembly factor-like uncharacterized protein
MKLWKLIAITVSFCFAIFFRTSYKREIVKPSVKETIQHFDGPAEFIKFHRSIRTPDDATAPQYPQGFIVSELRKAEIASASMHRSARTQSNGVLEWKERGPVNVPGRTRGLLVDPADPAKNTWFAGSASGGVWKTTNAGNSWTLITPDLPNLATTVLAMAESNPNVIYVGTGEGFGNVDGVQGNGIYKSIDRGVTWNYLSSTSSFDDINRMIVSPSDPTIAIAATNNGIYRTIDGGATWTKVSSRLLVQDLKATPGNFNVQYATQNSVGVIKSIDGGITWNDATAGTGAVNRVEIAVSPSKPNRIVASCESGEVSKFFMSDDGAATWSLVSVKLTTTYLNFLNGQGWYNNSIAFDPFNADIVYFGGIDLFQLRLGGISGSDGSYALDQANTQGFLGLTVFNGINGNFDLGTSAGTSTIEVRFGPGRSQKAHRFLVPLGATSGVLASNYSYQDYVTVPFEVWDVTNNRQLMASFRDQGRDGVFNLINFDGGNPTAILHSREYLFINNVDYNAAAPNSSIALNGGHEFNEIYNIWPFLSEGGTWPPTTNGILRFRFQPQLNATTQFITDGRAQYGNPSKNRIVHVDHHNIVMIPMSSATYKILNANDGGVFVSNTSATPGINDGNWTFAGRTFNTSQFYGADKRTGFDEYIGGMQDNGTWKSPPSIIASSTTDYLFNIGGDGFEVIWNNNDDKKLIGGSQGNIFRRSTDGGLSWTEATTGLSGSHPFISKLANSRDNPDAIYTLSSDGVFRSLDFGANWTLTPITNNWGPPTSFMDIEVSRANANIVWAGSGMSNSGTLRNLHVSTNGGVTFTATNNYTTVALGGITRLASHPSQPQTAYALFSFSGRPKILRTTDLGQTWNDITGFNTNATSSNGFPNVAVYCVYVRTDNPNIIWAGTEIGIVQSLNNGQTWALLEDFPNVSVWDMKGVDDQIVIATHGRGIWTATLNAAQQSAVPNPIILGAGTSPQSDFIVKINLVGNYDSTQVVVNNQRIGKLSALPIGERYVKIKNVTAGNHTVKLIAFKNLAPSHSVIFNAQKLNIKTPYQNQYSSVFQDITDFSLNQFSLVNFGTANQSLQSAHPYVTNYDATATLLQPIIVSTANSTFYYQDVALVQPSPTGIKFGQPGFKDFVVVEGTKNGVDWIALKDGYNASANPKWLTTYNVSTNQSGDPTLTVDQSIDLKTKFKATDTLLFRFRLRSDADAITGWGWSIDNLFIQQEPTGIEPESFVAKFEAYPNPSSGRLNIHFTLREGCVVTIEGLDVKGSSVFQSQGEMLPMGDHEKEIDLTDQSNGVYFVKLKTTQGSKTSKVLLKR